MNSICLSEAPRLDSDQVRTCHLRAEDLRSLMVSLASFVGASKKLKAQRDLYVASVSVQVQEMKANIIAKAETTMDKASGSAAKVNKSKELLGTEMQKVGSAAEKLYLENAINDVKKLGQEVNQKLQNVVDSFDYIAANCETLFTGIGPDNEYLL